MRHSGNYATMVNQRYLRNGVQIKLYIYDELDRFVTMGSVLLSTGDIDHMLNGINEHNRREAERDQLPLPPWQ